jgi:UDP-N-acetylglucosamine 2-epimerase (non-hydrolysing)
MKIMHVVGARPNFMKVAPILAEMRKDPGFSPVLVHTGQHYDFNMSEAFFRDLGLPAADEHLGVGSGSHAEQTARVMTALEPVLRDRGPDWVVVVGDVNSTLAAALVCAKLQVPVAHVEAGLRSFDRSMPEEINRLLTDQIADLLFTTEESANRNLEREGVARERIHFVGNVMIDSLLRALPQAEKSTVLERLAVTAGRYLVVTLHRPSNVDEPETLREILSALARLAADRTVVFAVHPRTRERIAGLGLALDRLVLVEPLGYLDFLKLTAHAALVLTDSGGLQEETTFLGVPCLTLRANTERPVTVAHGTNRLVASRAAAIEAAAREALAAPGGRNLAKPPFWDGRAAERIVAVFREMASRRRSC